MADLLLSESLLQNNDATQAQRDPFQQAQRQFQSNAGSVGGEVLSSSPMDANPIVSKLNKPLDAAASVSNQTLDPSDYKSLLTSLGIDSNGIALNDEGQTMLNQRLKDKFGDNLKGNSEAENVMKVFSHQMNKSIESANRTLGVLLSGSPITRGNRGF
jgi:hypothetical protein